ERPAVGIGPVGIRPIPAGKARQDHSRVHGTCQCAVQFEPVGGILTGDRSLIVSNRLRAKIGRQADGKSEGCEAKFHNVFGINSYYQTAVVVTRIFLPDGCGTEEFWGLTD